MGNTLNDIKNPHQFKLIWDSTTRIEEIPSPEPGVMLQCIALAFNSGQYYAAVVDVMSSTNYTLYCNMVQAGKGFKTSYAEITDEREHRAVDDFFLKAGVFEYYYRGANWEFPVTPQAAKQAGSKTNKDKNSYTYGKKNIYEEKGISKIPPWFRKYLD